tara:strand:+ start:1148 stop:1600 length:453 start_codon:yes stop_codon:yes gene_type:complete
MNFGRRQLDNSIRVANPDDFQPSSFNANVGRRHHATGGLVLPNSEFARELDEGHSRRLNPQQVAYFPEYQEQGAYLPPGSDEKVNTLFALGKLQEKLSYSPNIAVVGSVLFQEQAKESLDEKKQQEINILFQNAYKSIQGVPHTIEKPTD